MQCSVQQNIELASWGSLIFVFLMASTAMHTAKQFNLRHRGCPPFEVDASTFLSMYVDVHDSDARI